jgi:hypothetical protein
LASLSLEEELLDLFWIGWEAALGCLTENLFKIRRALLSGCALALSCDSLLRLLL